MPLDTDIATFKMKKLDRELQNQDRVLTNFRSIPDMLPFRVSLHVPGAWAASDSNYSLTKFMAPFPCRLISVYERHATAGTDTTNPPSVDVEKLSDSTAAGSGVSMLDTTISLAAVANVAQTVAPSNIISNIQLLRNQIVTLKSSGTLTGVNDVHVELLFGVLIKDLPI